MKAAALLLLVLVFSACSSPPPRPVFSDFLEIREVVDDDPLAARYTTAEGEEHHLDDPVVSGKHISRLQLKPGTDDRFDLVMTLTGAQDARWRRFARSRGRQAALVIDGRISRIFTVEDPGIPVENEALMITIPGVAETREDADKLDLYFEEKKTAMKKTKVLE
jgi:hypothetical protein